MSNLDDRPTLEQDDNLAEPLEKVKYEAGMMLGLDAARDEQAYHRRRLTRHQYWLHGYGTLAGLLVSMQPENHTNSEDDILVRLHVGPGIAIDGLGREVLVHETYCIDLREWLEARESEELLDGFDAGAELLWLKVSVRHKDCPTSKQPVLARKVGLSTDSVQPSRTADSIQLELDVEIPPIADDRYSPWANHTSLTNATPSLGLSEQQLLDDLAISNPEAAAQLAMHARMLHALEGNGVDTNKLNTELEERAGLLLARLSIQTADLTDIVVNPERIRINNLVRPFLTTASQLAWLRQQG